jgi:two-component system sensor histidine kinase and response regulator WspE
MSQASHAIASPMMLTLFHAELATHLTTLEEGLTTANTEAAPADRANMVRAAGAIKGAAAIIKLGAAAQLASAIGALLDRLTSSDPLPEPAQTALRQGIDCLRQLDRLATNETAEALRTFTPAVEAASAALAGVKATVVATPDDPVEAPGAAKISAADPMMFALFMTELDAHTGSLNDGLLVLEEDPTRIEHIESLMRAAHSIKGAARIVNLDPAVSLAHAMEDLFVSVGNGAAVLAPPSVDLLFHATDMLAALGNAAARDDSGEWARLRATAQTLTQALTAVNRGEPSTFAAELPRRSKVAEPPAQESKSAQAERESVRVSADNLDNMMNLAGEIMVNGRRMQGFAQRFKTMEQRFTALHGRVNDLQRELVQAEHALPSSSTALVRECADQHGDMTSSIHAFGEYAAGFERLSTRMHAESITSRMRPFADGVRGYPRMVRDIVKSVAKQVHFHIAGEASRVDRDILQQLDPPITHLLRNAIDHGIETPAQRLAAGKPATGQLSLSASHQAGQILIVIKDDGRGIDHELLRLKIVQNRLTDTATAARLSKDELLQFMFLPGFSTAASVTELSGRGVGLDIVKTMMQAVGGSIQISTEVGVGTSIRLLLPVTLSVLSAMVFEVAGEGYAFALARIERCLRLDDDANNKAAPGYITLDGEQVPVVSAERVLTGSDGAAAAPRQPCVIVIRGDQGPIGLQVDRYTGKRDLVVRPLDPRLGPTPCVACPSLMDDGQVVLILDVDDTSHFAHGLREGAGSGEGGFTAATESRQRILIIDDSATIRETERRLLQGAGYHVTAAVDGLDGWNALTASSYDLVISDVDMPRMHGLDFVARMRADRRFVDTPVIIVSYKDRDADRQRGMAAGADLYMTKSCLNDRSILRSVEAILGAGT